MKHMREMKQWFLKRGFSENKFDQEQGNVKSYKSSQRNNKRKKGVCLVITCHQFLENNNRIFPGTLIYFALIKNLKQFLRLVPWLCFVVQGKVAAI